MFANDLRFVQILRPNFAVLTFSRPTRRRQPNRRSQSQPFPDYETEKIFRKVRDQDREARLGTAQTLIQRHTQFDQHWSGLDFRYQNVQNHAESREFVSGEWGKNCSAFCKRRAVAHKNSAVGYENLEVLKFGRDILNLIL